MSRLLTGLALVGVGANVAMGVPFDQEEQNRNAECDVNSIQRQTLECEARNMPFTFDTEAVCGIKLTTSTSAAPTVTVTVTGGAGTQSSVPSASGSSSVLVATTMASTPVIAPTLSAGVNTPTATPSSGSAGRLRGSLVLVAAAGWMFW
ncbi:hypothetical protein CCUS01_10887 [Colletotrichum cuscutae]|uniref:Uncharacterized protein n=1 Tax=Colletotrichum cuscutae TaxID=1209917 RepID=A0AAI9XJG1_9PEZI|nr:hypothetical protein CCUS01_10887 [Colletotrichum cuscutae]